MKKYILNLLLLTAFSQCFAQKIAFESQTVNAGSTLWRKPITAVFRFTNKDKEPLTITTVDAGCGCMTPKWTNGAVQKGEKGEISVTYDAMMLGHFDRYIDVYTNQSEKPQRIRMKAVVNNGEKQTIDDLYPFNIGDICLNTDNIEFQDVHSNDSTTAVIEILNDGDEVYSPQLMHLPPYITAKYTPTMIARGRRGKIELTLHGSELKNYGLNQTNIYLARYAGDKVGQDNDLLVSAVLLPEAKEVVSGGKYPVFNVSTTNLNLGKLGNKKKLTGEVKLTNKGNAPLTIDNIQVFNQAITVALAKRELMPGEELKMKVEVWAKYLGLSKAEPRVLMITNDPNHPKETIDIKFE